MSKRHVPPSVPAEPYLRRDLLDPEFAAAYLSYTAESDDPLDFMIALRSVAEAYGGISSIARRAKLNRQQLYKTLSIRGNPEFRTLRAILGAAGFSLAVVPRAQSGKRATIHGRRRRPVEARTRSSREVRPGPVR
jgi:probable addiction module antidote protein